MLGARHAGGGSSRAVATSRCNALQPSSCPALLGVAASGHRRSDLVSSRGRPCSASRQVTSACPSGRPRGNCCADQPRACTAARSRRRAPASPACSSRRSRRGELCREPRAPRPSAPQSQICRPGFPPDAPISRQPAGSRASSSSAPAPPPRQFRRFRFHPASTCVESSAAAFRIPARLLQPRARSSAAVPRPLRSRREQAQTRVESLVVSSSPAYFRHPPTASAPAVVSSPQLRTAHHQLRRTVPPPRASYSRESASSTSAQYHAAA